MSTDVSSWWSALVVRARAEETTEAYLAWQERQERLSHLDAAEKELAALIEDHERCMAGRNAEANARIEAERRLGETENQNRFLRSWIRELREDGADAVSVDLLYGMLLDRITELATADPAADSPEGAQLTALADLCEAYEQRRGESAVGIAVEKQLPAGEERCECQVGLCEHRGGAWCRINEKLNPA